MKCQNVLDEIVIVRLWLNPKNTIITYQESFKQISNELALFFCSPKPSATQTITRRLYLLHENYYHLFVYIVLFPNSKLLFVMCIYYGYFDELISKLSYKSLISWNLFNNNNTHIHTWTHISTLRRIQVNYKWKLIHLVFPFSWLFFSFFCISLSLSLFLPASFHSFTLFFPFCFITFIDLQQTNTHTHMIISIP